MINIKKIIKVILVLPLLIFLSGCSKKDNKKIYKEIVDKIEKLNSYYISGELQMNNNDNAYKYDVEVNYLKSDYFKVSLTNKANKHKQVILRNNDGVYVITPSLNKSFKFQSEWPYNNSQSYLLQTIVKDLENDDEKKYEYKDEQYIFTGKVNYMNNTALKYQKVYFKKNKTLSKVEIFDKDDNIKIIMKFNKIKYNNKINKDIFLLDNNINDESQTSSSEKTSKIEDVIYPMYLPTNTKLTEQETIKTLDGERLIQNFTGDNSFTMIQETNNNKEYESIFCEGDPVILNESIGYSDEYSITWYDEKYSYYLASKDLSTNDMLQIAMSVTSPTIIK